MATGGGAYAKLVLSSGMTDAARLQELIIDLVSGKAGWSSVAGHVLHAALKFHIEVIKNFEALFGKGTGWLCIPMLPPERLLPFVTSPVYGDEYRPIVNTSDDGPPEWASFFDPAGNFGQSGPEDKTLSVRQAVALYFDERSKRAADDEAYFSLFQLLGRRSDGSWITVYTPMEEAAHSLKQVHDTLDFPARTTAARVHRVLPDGCGVWVYEVSSGERIVAEYSPVHDAAGRQQLDRALKTGNVQHYDFRSEATLRRLLGDRTAATVAAAMSHDGEPEQHPMRQERTVL